MDNLKKQKKAEKDSEKINKASKIVAKFNENGEAEVLTVTGTEASLLSTICIILQEIERCGGCSAVNMTKHILTVLEKVKEKEERNE